MCRAINLIGRVFVNKGTGAGVQRCVVNASSFTFHQSAI